MAANLYKSILFSDVVGSSKLYQKLGNAEAESTIRLVINTLDASVSKHGGRVIKTIGDEIMCCFDDLIHATEAAKEMNQLTLDLGIELKTGISTGKIIEKENDIFGDTVNSAAFLTKTARPREILIDETSLDNDHSGVVHEIELIAQMTIKGQSQSCKIYRLNWESIANSLGVTLVNRPSAQSTSTKTLELIYRDTRLSLSPVRPIIVLGRDNTHVSLKIDHAKVSRRHCTIQMKQGKFILEDHSTNGTYVSQQGADTTFVHRESFALINSGDLSLGNANAAEQYHLRYRIT